MGLVATGIVTLLLLFVPFLINNQSANGPEVKSESIVVTSTPISDPAIESELYSYPTTTTRPAISPTEIPTTSSTYGPVIKATKNPTPKPVKTITPAANTSPDFYTNIDGNQVQSPTYYNSAPAGATAKCADGTYSFSQHRSGTCSRHGGVVQWL